VRIGCVAWCATAALRFAATAPSRCYPRCAEATEKRPNTWINDEMCGFMRRFRRGRPQRRIVAGGILVGGPLRRLDRCGVFGESMFSRVTDASKVALVHLAADCGSAATLLDTQFLTPHLARFGGVEINRARYHRLLADALAYRASFPAALPTLSR